MVLHIMQRKKGACVCASPEVVIPPNVTEPPRVAAAVDAAADERFVQVKKAYHYGKCSAMMLGKSRYSTSACAVRCLKYMLMERNLYKFSRTCGMFLENKEH